MNYFKPKRKKVLNNYSPKSSSYTARNILNRIQALTIQYKAEALFFFFLVNSKPQVLVKALFKKLDEKCSKPTLKTNKRKDLRLLWTHSCGEYFLWNTTVQLVLKLGCNSWEKGCIEGSTPSPLPILQGFWYPKLLFYFTMFFTNIASLFNDPNKRNGAQSTGLGFFPQSTSINIFCA